MVEKWEWSEVMGWSLSLGVSTVDSNRDQDSNRWFQVLISKHRYQNLIDQLFLLIPSIPNAET